jgi:hypothetical protein
MEARIKSQTNKLNGKAAYAVITKNGQVARFPTKQQARQWAINNGYTLRYSG